MKKRLIAYWWIMFLFYACHSGNEEKVPAFIEVSPGGPLIYEYAGGSDTLVVNSSAEWKITGETEFKLMTWLLEHHPIYIWSFFFGLIIASSLLVAKEIRKWNMLTILALVAGIAAAYTITVMTPAETPDIWWFIVLSGAIAICAMILPGISGAFILLLMGKYSYILGAVSTFNIGVLLLFAVGAIAGIISFSHLLSWLLKHHHNTTVALLTGFMVGSLNKVWPWKETLQTYIDSHGVEKALVEANISPMYYEFLSQQNPLIWEAILMCVTGFFLIWGIEYIGRKIQQN